jgi:porphyrinogen peroxidase
MIATQSVVRPPAGAAVFLVATVAPGGEAAVRAALQDLPGLIRSVAFRAPDDGLTCVVGFSSAGWDRLFDAPKPRELHPFEALRGPRHQAPATPGDLLVHLRSRRMDLCFELARLITELCPALTIVDEVHGFKYFDERDLLGFVDGSENPEDLAAAEAVFIGEEDPRYRGGSYVIVQKYLHDLAAWQSLSVEEQERVIGRTKMANVELPDGVKPADSHVALNTIVEDGVERKIVRDNMPFGSVGAGEFGTYFIGYARTPAVTEQMLRNMFLGDPPGNTDRILDFSTAVTGGLFFVPSADFLDDLDDLDDLDTPATEATATDAPATEVTATDAPPVAGATDTGGAAGSLGIGSLKGA